MLTQKYEGANNNYDGNYNDGIKCTVDTCKHYKQGNHCNASKVEVDSCSQSAKESDNTMCHTFETGNTVK